MGIAESVLFFAWDLGVIFLGMRIFKKIFFEIQILGVIEKYIGWFLVCLFLGGWFD